MPKGPGYSRWTKAQLIKRLTELDPQGNAEAPLGPREAELVQRNGEIITALARGLSVIQVARTYGISDRQVRRVLEEWREANPGLRQRAAADALVIVDEVLEQWGGAAEELALVAAATKNDNARVGAIRARMDAISRRVELLQALGILPNDLGSLRLDIDVRYIAETVVRIMQQDDVPEETQLRIVDALRGGAGPANLN